MGALEGSLSFKSYYVDGEPPNDFHADYLKRLQRGAFEPLSPVGDDERHVGWVSVQHPLQSEFRREDIFFNQYILFGMRIDKWALPSTWLKALIKQETELRFAGQDVKISKRVKDEIKAEVVLALRQKTLPTMKLIDIVWNIAEHQLRFWSNSKAESEEFEEFFEETFDLRLRPESPYTMAEFLGFEQKALDKMLSATPWMLQPL
ncbi:MAG: recombination-associated protein RdgC [Bradymonadales bacterium]